MHDLYEGVAASTATIGMKEVEEEKKISLNLELSKIKEFSPLLCFRDGRLWLWLKWLFKVIFGGRAPPQPDDPGRDENRWYINSSQL